MVKVFKNEHVFPFPWNTVTTAFWNKYPNPSSPHVLNVDVLDRTVDQQSGVLRSKRLMTLKYNLPSWVEKLANQNLAGYAVEESTVDVKSQTLVLKSVNLSFSNVMTVAETCTYKQHPENPDWTLYTQEAVITSYAPGLLKNKLESLSESNCAKNASSGTGAVQKICEEMLKLKTSSDS
eukprot:GILI01023740.1.p1 GENE.GILI01023740.1~~GILI01023740.1.p1  ORF type:complete len:179 (-),score=9.61 GILI01023740.1:79-615(-)